MNEREIIFLADKYFSGSNRKIIKGIGDDTAVLMPEKGFQLFTSDMLVEGTHFLFDKITPYDLGWKSLAVNISDIASMGGFPTYATLSIGLNKKTDHDWLDKFYQGIADCSEEFNVNIAGGDTVSSPETIVINIALLGNAIKPIYRNSLENGYIITSTGDLGLSGAGLSLILGNTQNLNTEENYCIEKHNKPFPRVKEGIFLSSNIEKLAMMDCSDGLYVSLKTLAQTKNLGVDIYGDNIVISDNFKKVAQKFNKNPLEYTLYGGEDYELIVAMPEESFHKIRQDYFDTFGYKLEIIAKFTNKHNQIKLNYADMPEVLTDKSFQHFK